jgi:hypothetical protein
LNDKVYKELKMSKAANIRAVLLTETELDVLYVALTELEVFSDKEAKQIRKLKTKLFEAVCLPATA